MSTLRVSEDEITMTDDYCYMYQDEPFTGMGFVVVEGQLIRETAYWNGFRHGLTRAWHWETGTLKEETMLQKNGAHGIVQYWYENGQRKSLEWLEQAILIKSVTWDQFGRIVEVYELDEEDTLYDILQLSKQVWVEAPSLMPEEEALQAKQRAELDRIMEAYWNPPKISRS